MYLTIVVAHVVRNMIVSGPQRRLKTIQATISTHIQDCDKAVELVMRRRALTSHHASVASENHGNMNLGLTIDRPRENRAFVGREQVLRQMHDWFTERRSYPCEPTSCILYGMGGIGKTQTAIKYSYVDKDEYDSIFWVTAETIPLLVSSFSMILSKMRIVDSGVLADDSTVRRTREWLEETGKLRGQSRSNKALLKWTREEMVAHFRQRGNTRKS